MTYDDRSQRPNAKPTQPVKSEAELDQAAFDSKMRQWFAELDPDIQKKLSTYYSELVRFNKVINLVSPNTLKTAASIHFADSILAGRMVLKSMVPGAPIYDLGSGNGFPGLVLAIVRPDIKFILVDRDTRKSEFLKFMGTNLKLSNLAVENAGVEDIGAGVMKNVVSRGFAPLPKALLIARKQVAVGGKFFHMKSDGWANEMASVPSQLFSYWTPSLLGQYRLPETSHDMAVILTDKTGE